LLTIIGLSHAEDVTYRATRGVADHNDTTVQEAVADDSTFTIVLAFIHYLNREASEDDRSVFEVKASIREGLLAFGRIVGDAHPVSVATITELRKAFHWAVFALSSDPLRCRWPEPAGLAA
jgi:hypothetical protein